MSALTPLPAKPRWEGSPTFADAWTWTQRMATNNLAVDVSDDDRRFAADALSLLASARVLTIARQQCEALPLTLAPARAWDSDDQPTPSPWALLPGTPYAQILGSALQHLQLPFTPLYLDMWQVGIRCRSAGRGRRGLGSLT